MRKRLILFLATVASLALGCSLTAPRAAVMAAQPPTPTEPAPKPQTAPSPTPGGLACVVTAQALNVRTCPSVACPVSGWLQADDLVTVAGMATGWAELPAGGFVNSAFLDCGGTP